MELVNQQEFTQKIRQTHQDKSISKKSYYQPTATLPKKLTHDSFDGGKYATTYMSSRLNA